MLATDWDGSERGLDEFAEICQCLSAMITHQNLYVGGQDVVVCHLLGDGPGKAAPGGIPGRTWLLMRATAFWT